jgi:hypothetical protein
MGILHQARLVVLAGLPACLLLSEAPEFASGGLVNTCEYDSDCADGYVCDWLFDECVVECRDEDCSGGWACDPEYNDCADYCYDDGDCKDGYRCCEYSEYDDGLCDYASCWAG